MGIPIQDQDPATGLDQSGRRYQPAQSRADYDDVRSRSHGTYQNGESLFGPRSSDTVGLIGSPPCSGQWTVGSVPVR